MNWVNCQYRSVISLPPRMITATSYTSISIETAVLRGKLRSA